MLYLKLLWRTDSVNHRNKYREAVVLRMTVVKRIKLYKKNQTYVFYASLSWTPRNIAISSMVLSIMIRNRIQTRHHKLKSTIFTWLTSMYIYNINTYRLIHTLFFHSKWWRDIGNPSLIWRKYIHVRVASSELKS